jgi:hypothetical protein
MTISKSVPAARKMIAIKPARRSARCEAAARSASEGAWVAHSTTAHSAMCHSAMCHSAMCHSAAAHSTMGHSTTVPTAVRCRHGAARHRRGAECDRRGNRKHCLTHASSPLDVDIRVLRK